MLLWKKSAITGRTTISRDSFIIVVGRVHFDSAIGRNDPSVLTALRSIAELVKDMGS